MLIFNALRARSRRRLRLASLLVLPLALLLTPLSLLSQPAEPANVTAAPTQAMAIDHAVFDSLLQRHVVGGFVDYDAFARSAAFTQYLAALGRASLDGVSEDERLAFWINVYNAYTIQLIVAHRETGSIRNINKSLGVLRLKGPWSEPLVQAAGQRLSLDDVFHGILRKGFAEPRIHFAVSCGAIACAPLRSEAYTGDRLVDQLNDQGRRFFRDSPMRNRIDRNRVQLSPILMAYRNDFGAGRLDFMRAIAPWFEGEERKRLTDGRYILIENTFDWALNSQAIGRARGLLQPPM